MKSVFTFDEIRDIEKKIIETGNVPSLLLMENAGKNSCDSIISQIPGIRDKEIYILCGKGNNAGDGFTLARHLLIKDISCTVVMLVSHENLKGDALKNYGLLSLCKCDIIDYPEFQKISSKFQKRKNIILVDAILGTGIKGDLDETFRNVIEHVNSLKEKNSKLTIISLDIPSGIMSGEQINPVIDADYTVLMGTYKAELLFGAGKESRGEMTVVPIGITEALLDENNSYGKYLIELEDIQKIFPRRKKTSHKYSGGKVLVIGGSKGLSGAVIMSSVASLKSGAGAAVAAIPVGISPAFNKKLFEVMTVELDETPDGTINKGQFDKIRKRIDWADVVLIGPGISTNENTKEFVFDVIGNCEKPMVIDADGLNIVSDNIQVIKNRKFNNEIFLTPHPGEFSRLTTIDIKDVMLHRFELVSNFAEENKVNISLKSETTVSYTCKNDNEYSGKFYINSTGNESLATAGSGDVLSGIIASMYAQTKNPVKTLVCGNYLHGLCADLYAKKYGNKQTATPQDILKFIPKAITKILN
ncbi:MAG: NAD(P)H-hydrate dehydratase [Ignavibacteria bacterium]